MNDIARAAARESQMKHPREVSDAEIASSTASVCAPPHRIIEATRRRASRFGESRRGVASAATLLLLSEATLTEAKAEKEPGNRQFSAEA